MAQNHHEHCPGFFDTARRRLTSVLDHVQIEGEQQAKALIAEMDALIAEAEANGLNELAETARDALAEAWRWRRGDEPMDSRVRLARLARGMWRAVAAFSEAGCCSSRS